MSLLHPLHEDPPEEGPEEPPQEEQAPSPLQARRALGDAIRIIGSVGLRPADREHHGAFVAAGVAGEL
jgi:hypothetical protein